MLAFQLIFNAAILVVCLYILLAMYRSVQKQEEDILDIQNPSDMFEQEPRSNPWVNFLQEPIKKLGKGRTGIFKSFERELKGSPVYMIT
jgi:hypothetical protein